MNKLIKPEDLYEYNFTVKIINALKQRWIIQNKFSCIGTPKQYNLLQFFSGSKGKYTLKNGQTHFADEGDIVYTPKNSEYSVEFFGADKNTGTSIGINFFIYDEMNEELYFDNDILVIKAKNPKYYHFSFSKIAEYSAAAVRSPAKMKSVFYEILSSIGHYYRHESVHTKKFEVISTGIRYLEDDEAQTLTIKEIASLCNVSEIYFRKLFKLYSGTPPVEYKLNTRIAKAMQYLETSNLSVREISELTGFKDPAYFSKMFKEKNGFTPKEYRQTVV